MLFPKWTNYLPAILLLVLGGGFVFTVFIFWYWSTDKHLVVGYQPSQPIKYSHKLHVNDLGMDCRYCHYNVEYSKKAGVPASEVCMGCHTQILPDSPEIQKLKKYHEANRPVPWVRVYQLPDYAFFDHSAHVNKGVGCVECHGRVDQMAEVSHVSSLTMGWCLDCHNNPAPSIKDKKLITAVNQQLGEEDNATGKKLLETYHINTRIDCSTCHR
jgi:hypothetical protein